MDRALSRTLRLSIMDGLCYAAMVGFGEFYFVALAVRLGATPEQTGMVVVLPLCVGSLGPLVALGLLRVFRRRKPLVVAMALGQAGVYAYLLARDLAGSLSPWELIIVVSLYQLFGQGCGTTWASWFGDLVPAGVRGQYFARRNGLVHLATLVALLCAGGMLQWLENGGPGVAVHTGIGFTVIFAIAALARLVSVCLLTATRDPASRTLPSMRALKRGLRTARGVNVLRLMLLAAAFQMAVYVGSPYFAPFMLKELRFSYLEYTAAQATVVVVKVLAMRRWGPAIDQHGPRQVYVLALILVALVPLPWLWAQGLGMVMIAQLVSGFAWAGHEVSMFTLILESTVPAIRMPVLALHTLLNGVAQLIGGALGAYLLRCTGQDYVALFLATLVVRTVVALPAPFLVRNLRSGRPVGRGGLLLRVIGVRPNGGLVHRPIE